MLPLLSVQVSVTIAAAAVASLFGGLINDIVGRRPAILLASCVFTAGAILMALSQSKEMLLAGRLTVGLGVGKTSWMWSLENSIGCLHKLTQTYPLNCRKLSLPLLYYQAITFITAMR